MKDIIKSLVGWVLIIAGIGGIIGTFINAHGLIELGTGIVLGLSFLIVGNMLIWEKKQDSQIEDSQTEEDEK